MSDAGKVMIDSSGNLILGAGGKAVLADDLYPMWYTPTPENYVRLASGYDLSAPASCPASDVWDASWSSEAGAIFDWFRDYGPGEWSFTGQAGIIVTIPELNVEWSRTKAIRVRVQIEGGVGTGQTLRVTWAKDVTSMPSGKAIRDSWDTAKTYFEEIPSPWTPNYDWFWIEIPTDGVKPADSVGIAAAFDVDTCPFSASGGGGGTVHLWVAPFYPPFDPPDGGSVQIIYNLAT